MPEVLIPLTFEDLPTRPPLVGRPRMTEDLQQTVALLVGWDGSTRRLVRVSPSGIVFVASLQVKGIINEVASGDADTYQGADIQTTEILIKAKQTNVGRIWANVGVAAAVNTGYPLDAGEWVNFSINNLHSLHLYFVKDTDYAIIVYTK